VRTGDAAFPDITEYPSHNACLKCHHEQFFNGRPPAICTICHVNPTPRNSARQPFANPVETFEKSAKGRVAQSDFRVYFPHENHSDVVGGNTAGKNGTQAAHARPQDANCAVCHSLAQPQGDADQEFLTPPPANWGDNFWLKKGTFQTAPRGHKTCFECHYSTGDIINPPPSECAACHRLAPARPVTPDFNAKLAAQIKIPDRATLASWRERDSSGTFRHEIHSETKCAACHNTAKMNTADLSTLKVPIMSCGGEGCHITPTTDDGGALNYELDQRQADAKFQCAKCHLSLAGKPVPASHTNAVAAYKAKKSS
jgi:hypothetical protein